MSDTVLERIRMCVAEAGYDADLVHRGSMPAKGTIRFPPGMPVEVAWRAREMVCAAHQGGTNGPMCLRCSTAIYTTTDERALAGLRSCRSEEWLTEDCGLARD